VGCTRDREVAQSLLPTGPPGVAPITPLPHPKMIAVKLHRVCKLTNLPEGYRIVGRASRNATIPNPVPHTRQPPSNSLGGARGHGSYLESISALAELSAHKVAVIGAYRFCHEHDFIGSDGKSGCCHLFSNRKYDALQCLLYAVFL